MISRTAEKLEAYFSGEGPECVASAYLFGSEAAGRAHRESDVDVGVLLDWARCEDRPRRAELREHMISDLVHVLDRNEVDLVILNDSPPELGRAIVTKGVRVFLGHREADHAYVRDVQLRAADMVPWMRRMRRLKLEAIRR
jgi:predicted nucleotidyltransferase